jgi:hypothetical protein
MTNVGYADLRFGKKRNFEEQSGAIFLCTRHTPEDIMSEVVLASKLLLNDGLPN